MENAWVFSGRTVARTVARRFLFTHLPSCKKISLMKSCTTVQIEVLSWIIFHLGELTRIMRGQQIWLVTASGPTSILSLLFKNLLNPLTSQLCRSMTPWFRSRGRTLSLTEARPLPTSRFTGRSARTPFRPYLFWLLSLRANSRMMTAQ